MNVLLRGVKVLVRRIWNLAYHIYNTHGDILYGLSGYVLVNCDICRRILRFIATCMLAAWL